MVAVPVFVGVAGDEARNATPPAASSVVVESRGAADRGAEHGACGQSCGGLKRLIFAVDAQCGQSSGASAASSGGRC